MSNTLLTQVRALLTIDIDSMDQNAAARLTQGSTLFKDMTSNQAIVHGQATLQWDHLSPAVVEYVRANGLDISSEEDILKIINYLTVLLAKQVLPYLTGRVHAQTSPSIAYDTQKTVDHARALVALFEAHGVPKDRVCIKILATPESIIACQRLEAPEIGIRTLATCLFSVSQAVAASQAGCLYVAPYFNELRVHFQPPGTTYNDPLRKHPVIPVISSIVQAFKELGSKTLVMPASIVSLDEIIALTKLGPDHLTISATILEEMAKPSTAVEEGALNPVTSGVDLSNEILRTNYLADGGKVLAEAIDNDAETTRKLKDALLIFGEMEQRTKEFLRKDEALAIKA
ncbi:hypothetical protein F5I97DRAFT_1910352 [Phlebopus sp. FC_14]|nr:hypothetical protein F5I97DRAFT_1910352 [Phlebopus sp. FC_14]